MIEEFSYKDFISKFPSDQACLEEIKRLKFEGGIYCRKCKMFTKHYRIKKRPVYGCKFCRTQISPLSGTVFAKSATPLSYWFYVIFLMTQARGDIKASAIQEELGVTYKTAWRMKSLLYKLMEKNKGDLLSEEQVRRWTFFNKLELRVVRKTSY